MRREWENGTIQLSPAIYNSYKLDFLKIYNYQLTEEMHNANRLVDRVRADWDYIINYGTGKPPTPPDYYEYSKRYRQFYAIELDTFEKLFLHRKHTWPPQYLTDLNIGYARANQRTFNVDNYEAQINFRTSDKTVTWTVSQNYNAVSIARNSLIGKEFFKSMDALEWVEPYGGDIIGNDGDNDGNPNYISYTFG